MLAARHHPPSRRKIKEIWHGRVFWEEDSNTTMLRSSAEKVPITQLEDTLIKEIVTTSHEVICQPHVVFTTFKCPKCDSLRQTIEDNTLHTWSKMNDVTFKVIANAKTNEHGVPILGDMYTKMFHTCPDAQTYTYVNGDIMGTSDFVETLEAVQPIGDFLMVGKRTNVPWSENHDAKHTNFNFDSHFRRGALFRSDAQDYFTVTKNAIDWKTIPPFVVGRPGYDNWLVDHIYHNSKVALIDATKTISVIHQTDAEGNVAQGGKMVKSSSDREYNRLIGKGQWDHGRTTHAEWETERVSGTIILKNRKSNTESKIHKYAIQKVIIIGKGDSAKPVEKTKENIIVTVNHAIALVGYTDIHFHLDWYFENLKPNLLCRTKVLVMPTYLHYKGTKFVHASLWLSKLKFSGTIFLVQLPDGPINNDIEMWSGKNRVFTSGDMAFAWLLKRGYRNFESYGIGGKGYAHYKYSDRYVKDPQDKFAGDDVYYTNHIRERIQKFGATWKQHLQPSTPADSIVQVKSWPCLYDSNWGTNTEFGPSISEAQKLGGGDEGVSMNIITHPTSKIKAIIPKLKRVSILLGENDSFDKGDIIVSVNTRLKTLKRAHIHFQLEIPKDNIDMNIADILVVPTYVNDGNKYVPIEDMLKKMRFRGPIFKIQLNNGPQNVLFESIKGDNYRDISHNWMYKRGYRLFKETSDFGEFDKLLQSMKCIINCGDVSRTNLVQNNVPLFEQIILDSTNGDKKFLPTSYWQIYFPKTADYIRNNDIGDLRRSTGGVLRAFGASMYLWPDLTHKCIHKANERGTRLKTTPLLTMAASDVGLPPSIILDNKSYNLHFINAYERYLTLLESGIDLNSVTTYVEIGSGIGNQVELFKKMFPHWRFYLFDLAPQLYVAHQWLLGVFPEDVIPYEKTRLLKTPLTIDKGKIGLFPTNKLVDWKAPPGTLFWNAASFEEMPRQTVHMYSNIISNAGTEYVYNTEWCKQGSKSRRKKMNHMEGMHFNEYREMWSNLGFEEKIFKNNGQTWINCKVNDNFCSAVWQKIKGARIFKFPLKGVPHFQKKTSTYDTGFVCIRKHNISHMCETYERVRKNEREKQDLQIDWQTHWKPSSVSNPMKFDERYHTCVVLGSSPLTNIYNYSKYFSEADVVFAVNSKRPWVKMPGSTRVIETFDREHFKNKNFEANQNIIITSAQNLNAYTPSVKVALPSTPRLITKTAQLLGVVDPGYTSGYFVLTWAKTVCNTVNVIGFYGLSHYEHGDIPYSLGDMFKKTEKTGQFKGLNMLLRLNELDQINLIM